MGLDDAGAARSHRFSFGEAGNGVDFLMSGWSRPEPDFTWTLGHESLLELPAPPVTDGDLYIEFALDGFRHEPTHITQRLSIDINGVALPSEKLISESFLGYRVDGDSLRGARSLRIHLSHPDAVNPAEQGISPDGRTLAFALRAISMRCVPVQPPFSRQLRGPLALAKCAARPQDHEMIRGLTGLSLQDLCLSIESLGLNCEFGLLQRRCGTEPLGLLRFAGLGFSGLMRGLDDGFQYLDKPECQTCYIVQAGWDWMVRNTNYDLSYHTFRTDADIPAADLLAEQIRVLRFRRDKFRELLGSGEKLFLINRPEGMSEAEALALVSRLRRHGPNALLYISATTGQKPGTVEAILPYLFRGSMDGVERMGDAAELVDRDNWLSDAGMTVWIGLCAHAYRLWRENRSF